MTDTMLDKPVRPLLIPNLLNDVEVLSGLLVDSVAAGSWLDAFLLAAGIEQVMDDALHPDPLALRRIASRLATGRP
ncbi:MAG: hypothetical protein ACHQ7M_23455, partial [Chloroflexota bacterium]